MTATKSVRVEFGGGLELLFSNQKSHKVEIPNKTFDDKPTDMNYLILWLKKNLLREREELFLDNNTVRPGILVLINDTDWELEGEGDYIVENNDEIVFISTLHGG
ncbi:ubiquitin related modifier 1 [Thelephora ganbajun]|uniref:Ubiquitin related modifier 1 n=1 Tax=Thelephora ganbajun TaxID=370292 RepID=A0ACB6Z6V9_THEGA|nr:ubiquitin related modifier 1 [Thelephora ganbajun]